MPSASTHMVVTLTKRSSDWARALTWTIHSRAETDNVAIDSMSFRYSIRHEVALILELIQFRIVPPDGDMPPPNGMT